MGKLKKPRIKSKSRSSASYEIPTFKMLECSGCGTPSKVDGDTVKFICSKCSIMQSLSQFQRDEELKKLKKRKKI